MELPDVEALDEMAGLIANSNFANLGPEQRARVVELVNQSDMVGKLDDIDTRLDNIHYELKEFIAPWFKLSKLWEGL